MCRLVEAELLFQFFNNLGVQSGGAGIPTTVVRWSHGLRGAHIGGARKSAHTGGLSQRLFDGATRRELNDDEIDQHDAEQGRKNQEQTFGDIRAH